MLKLQNYLESFIIECDASGRGVGVVLMQSQKPITFMRKLLKRMTFLSSTYEKELFALVEAVQNSILIY